MFTVFKLQEKLHKFPYFLCDSHFLERNGHFFLFVVVFGSLLVAFLASTMRSKMVYLVLLACLITEDALALQLRQPQGRRTAEIDAQSLTGNTFTLMNGTVLNVWPLSTDMGQDMGMQQPQPRRRLGDFRECSPCTCCDSTHRWCLPTVCCYHINCGARDLPFGLCSFMPISCSCLGCRD